MPIHPNMLIAARKLLKSPHRFATDDELALLYTLSPAELDQFQFGVIELSDSGYVRTYNEYESNLAQRKKEDVLGKDFFAEIAPCTNTPVFSGIFFHGVQHDDLHAFVSYVFDFKMSPTHVWIHMYRCPISHRNWILVKKRDSNPPLKK